MPGVHAAVTGGRVRRVRAERWGRSNATSMQALALRGVHDLELVMIDTWSEFGLFEEPEQRVERALSSLRERS